MMIFRTLWKTMKIIVMKAGLSAIWTKKLDIRLCGTTYETNKKLNLYYCPSSWGYQRCKYLGLYTKKEVRNIGEITAIAVIEAKNGNIKKLEFSSIEGNLTEEMKENAQKAFEEAYQYEYDLTRCPHRFFFCRSILQDILSKNITSRPTW